MAEEMLVELEPVALRGRRGRRKWVVRAVGAIAVVGLLVAIVTLGGDEPADLASSEPAHIDAMPPHVGSHDSAGEGAPVSTSEATSTTEAASDQSVGPGVLVPGDADALGAAPAATTPEPTTSTTVCLNSFDPGCGPFRWARDPGSNQPMTASIELLTEDLVPGEEMELRIKASDPDATPSMGAPWLAQSDPHLVRANCDNRQVREAFGPWMPPSPRPGAVDHVASRRVPEPGTYRVYTCLLSRSWPFWTEGASEEEMVTWCPGGPSSPGWDEFVCRDPYSSFAAPYVEIVVPEPEP